MKALLSLSNIEFDACCRAVSTGLFLKFIRELGSSHSSSGKAFMALSKLSFNVSDPLANKSSISSKSSLILSFCLSTKSFAISGLNPEFSKAACLSRFQFSKSSGVKQIVSSSGVTPSSGVTSCCIAAACSLVSMLPIFVKNSWHFSGVSSELANSGTTFGNVLDMLPK